MKIFTKTFFFMCLFGAKTLCCSGDVSIRNGNFYIEFWDYKFSSLRGNTGMKIDRVYNSKSPYLGMFGWGWGCEYEDYLTVNPDGSISMHESGGGATNNFEPLTFDQTAKSNAVEMIANFKNESGLLTSDELSVYKAKLMTKKEFFLDEWESLIKSKKVKPFKVSEGVELVSKRFGFEIITKTKDGYERKSRSKTEIFDDSGRLMKIAWDNGDVIYLTHDKSGLLKEMSDSYNNKFVFNYTKNKFVSSLMCIGKIIKICYYRYNPQNELISSRDGNDNHYQFRYSNDKRHNLTKVIYDDHTSLSVNYYDRNKFENVKNVIDRDGSKTTYDYKDSIINDHESTLEVTLKIFGNSKTLISTCSYKYYFFTVYNGDEITSRLVSNIDGIITDKYYNNDGNTVKIVRDSSTTEFKYDNRGNIIFKETDDAISEIKYDPGCGAITQIKTITKGTKNNHQVSFSYNDKCLLKNVADSAGTKVDISYDPFGRISQLYSSKTAKTYHLLYNTSGKMIQVQSKDVGTIYFKYGKDGEVTSIKCSCAVNKRQELMRELTDIIGIVDQADEFKTSNDL